MSTELLCPQTKHHPGAWLISMNVFGTISNHRLITLGLALCLGLPYLLRDRAAVFFRHSLPHGLFHRFHLFSKRDAGGSG